MINWTLALRSRRDLFRGVCGLFQFFFAIVSIWLKGCVFIGLMFRKFLSIHCTNIRTALLRLALLSWIGFEYCNLFSTNFTGDIIIIHLSFELFTWFRGRFRVQIEKWRSNQQKFWSIFSINFLPSLTSFCVLKHAKDGGISSSVCLKIKVIFFNPKLKF